MLGQVLSCAKKNSSKLSNSASSTAERTARSSSKSRLDLCFLAGGSIISSSLRYSCSSSLNCAKLHETCASFSLFLTTDLFYSCFSNASIRLIKAKSESFIDFVNLVICDAKFCDAVSAKLSSDLGSVRFWLRFDPVSGFNLLQLFPPFGPTVCVDSSSAMIIFWVDGLAATMSAASGQRSDSVTGKFAETASDEFLALDQRVTKFALIHGVLQAARCSVCT